tara:strand:- start:157 stop:609 length:453 start_codon:yes stop_codon:yes gene_type:complete
MTEITDQCYDLEGKECTFKQWAKIFSENNKSLKYTTINKIVAVSTVWLGKTNFGSGKLNIYETIVFQFDRDSDKRDELECFRYDTKKEALEGHETQVKIYEKTDIEICCDCSKEGVDLQMDDEGDYWCIPCLEDHWEYLIDFYPNPLNYQ